MVMMGGFAYYSWSSARAEDEEETIRIKDETEKMERLAKEFTDIDEQVTVDEDLMASLKKRMGNSTDNTTATGEGGADGGAPPAPTGGGDSGGGAAVLEPPSAAPAPAPEPAEEPPTASAEDIARLNKMFGMGDADK